MDIDDIKRKLRELKQLEQKIRYGKSPLVWDSFFNLKQSGIGKTRYPLNLLAAMDHETMKLVIGEYLSFVYHQLFSESEIPVGTKYDTSIMIQWGLPADADRESVKKRFRELAKLYHPDTGGNAEQFISLMEDYKKLTGR